MANAVILEPLPEDWAWLNSITRPLDEDFLEAVAERPRRSISASTGRFSSEISSRHERRDCSARSNQMFANRLRTYQPSDFGMPSIVHHELCLRRV